MERRHLIPSRTIRLNRPALIAALVLGLIASGARAVADPGAEDIQYPTHRTLVLGHLDSLARDILDEFPFQRGKPLRIQGTAVTGDTSYLEDALGRAFVDAGFLLMSSGGTADTARWNLHYDFERCDLRLGDPTRRSFLGRVWLRRSFEVRAQLELRDARDEELLWAHRIDTTFQDWIPKREARRMAEPDTPLFAPPIPTSTLDRLGRPVLVGALAGSVAVLFLILR